MKDKFATIEKKDIQLVTSNEENNGKLEGLTQFCSLTVLRAIEAYHHGLLFFFFLTIWNCLIVFFSKKKRCFQMVIGCSKFGWIISIIVNRKTLKIRNRAPNFRSFSSQWINWCSFWRNWSNYKGLWWKDGKSRNWHGSLIYIILWKKH